MTPSRTGENPVRVAIIGTGRRSGYLYGPLLHALEDTELVAVWGRSAASAEALGAQLGVPAYTDLDRLLRETAPQVGVVSVDSAANGQVGRLAVEHGLHVLLETPIARQLSEADAIIAAAQRHRRAEDRGGRAVPPPAAGAGHLGFELALIASGMFLQRGLGRVHTSFNDFAGHAYHGVSVLRSYLGFDSGTPAAAGHRRRTARAVTRCRPAPAARRRSTASSSSPAASSACFIGATWPMAARCAGGAAVASWRAARHGHQRREQLHAASIYRPGDSGTSSPFWDPAAGRSSSPWSATGSGWTAARSPPSKSTPARQPPEQSWILLELPRTAAIA